ncbi:MAG TPA: signal peptide peptidase SppA [Bryobacteraceae bacterium]|nr:signal peptide peptidase SppA [Bryobacteraceae bacterium]
MKKFLLGILVGVVLAALTAVVLVLSAVRLGDSKAAVASGTTLVLPLAGGLPEKPPVSLPIPFIGGPAPLTVHDIWSTLSRAATDQRIKALVIELGRLDAGWAKVDELRQNIANFRKSGKPVYVFLKAPRTREYYLATAGDRIFCAPEDIFDVKGIRAELLYWKNTLDKIGVRVHVQYAGRYKDAGDTYTQTSMAPSTRESLGLVLDGLYTRLVSAVAEGRKQSPQTIQAWLDDGPYTAQQAANKGLVDALRFEDQVYGDLEKKLASGTLKKMSVRDYMRAIGPERDGNKRVALVVGEGAILRGSGSDAMGTDEGFTSGAFIRMLRRVREDAAIQGVILRVDSPGGDAFASDEILREVKLLRDRKPTVISMSDYAASGGYYVAMTGDPVVAYPSTITGSIGVLFTMVDIKGLYDKLGINREVLTRGRNADIDSLYGPPSEEARAKIQSGIDEFYRDFVGKVAAGRKRPYEAVAPLAEGRVWLGQHARERGLVDELGGLDKAVEILRKKAGFAGGDKLQIVTYPPKRTVWEQLMKAGEAPSVEARIARLLGIDPRAFEHQGYLRMAPYRLALD